MEVFGGKFLEVMSFVDLNLVLFESMLFFVLNGGEGVLFGKIVVFDGV